MGLFRHRLHATEGLGKLAQHAEQFGLVAIPQDVIDRPQGQGRVAANWDLDFHP